MSLFVFASDLSVRKYAVSEYWKKRNATFLSMIRSGIVFIPILWIFSHVFGLLGIQISQVTADIISAAITLPFVVSFFRSMPEDSAENS